MTVSTIYVQVTHETNDAIHALAVLLHRPPETVAARALEAAVRDFPADGRYLVIDGETLDNLERIFGQASVLNGSDLQSKVARLAGITYGNIRFDFSPGQLEEIERRAERLSMTPEKLIRMTVKKMEELFFTHLGTGGQG